MFCCVCGKEGKWPFCDECAGKRAVIKVVTKEKIKKPTPTRAADYYEAIIQMRNKEIEGFIIKKSCEVSKEKKSIFWRENDDLYFKNHLVAKKVAELVKTKFNEVDVLQTRKHVGFDRHKSKRQYKWTIRIR